MLGLPINWQTFELLNHSLCTGQPAAELINPGGNWAYYAQHPEEGRIFNEAMTGKAHGQIAGILAGYDFSSFEVIADIGGGRGHLLAAILAAYPKARGVIFDQPHVVKDAEGTASARLKLQSGDFFKDALPDCDGYVIMQVIGPLEIPKVPFVTFADSPEGLSRTSAFDGLLTLGLFRRVFICHADRFAILEPLKGRNTRSSILVNDENRPVHSANSPVRAFLRVPGGLFEC